MNTWDDMEAWPWLLPMQITEIVAWNAGEIPVGPLKGKSAVEVWLLIKENIIVANGALLHAKNRDELDIAKEKQKFWNAKEKDLLDGIRKFATEGFRLGVYAGYGFTDTRGVRRIIVPGDWPQVVMDWDTGTVIIREKHYTDVRFIDCRTIPDDLRQIINEDIKKSENSAPPVPPPPVPIRVVITDPVAIKLETPGNQDPDAPKETPFERKTRLTKWLEEEKKINPVGAQTRVAKREGVSRQTIAKILESYPQT